MKKEPKKPKIIIGRETSTTNVIYGLFLAVLSIAITMVVLNVEDAYYGFVPKLISFLIWMVVSSICIYQHTTLIKIFPENRVNNKFTYFTFFGMSIIFIIGCIGFRWITFLSFSVGIVLLFVKVTQMYNYGVKTYLDNTALRHIYRIRKYIILFFLLFLLSGLYVEVNGGFSTEWVSKHIETDLKITNIVKSLEKSNAAKSVLNYNDILKDLDQLDIAYRIERVHLYLALFVPSLILIVYIFFRSLRIAIKIEDEDGNVVDVDEFHKIVENHFNSLREKEKEWLSVKNSMILMRWWHSLSAGILGGIVYFKLSNDLLNSILCSLMIFCTCSYGFVINNIFDRFKDSIRGVKKIDLLTNKNQLTDAKILSIALVIFSVASSLFLDVQSVIINLSVLLVLTVYSYINNRFGIIANILTCLCVSLIFWIYPIYSSSMVNVIFLSSFAFLYMMSREFILDDYDKEDDLKVNKTSLSINYGSKIVKYTSLSMLISMIVIFSTLIFQYDLPWLFFIPVLIGSSLNIYGIVKYFNQKSDSSFNFYYKISSLGYLTAFFAILFL